MRKGTSGLLFDLVKIPFVVASPFLVANQVGQAERSGWDPDNGDPDGESIVQAAQFVSGLATFVAALLLVLIAELARRRWRNRRDKTEMP
jgi:hypothetical protein